MINHWIFRSTCPISYIIAKLGKSMNIVDHNSYMVFLKLFKPGHVFPLPEISRGICGPKVRRSLPDHIVAVIQDQAVEAKHLQNRTTSGAVPLTSPISRPHAEPPKGQSKKCLLNMFKHV
jgi:hypothetical protein